MSDMRKLRLFIKGIQFIAIGRPCITTMSQVCPRTSNSCGSVPKPQASKGKTKVFPRHRRWDQYCTKRHSKPQASRPDIPNHKLREAMDIPNHKLREAIDIPNHKLRGKNCKLSKPQASRKCRCTKWYSKPQASTWSLWFGILWFGNYGSNGSIFHFIS